MADLTKSELTKYALARLQGTSFEAWNNSNSVTVRGRTFKGKKGVSDIAGFDLHTGCCMYCEVKTINDQWKPEQPPFLEKVSRAGGFAFVAIQNTDGDPTLLSWERYKQLYPNKLKKFM